MWDVLYERKFQSFLDTEQTSWINQKKHLINSTRNGPVLWNQTPLDMDLMMGDIERTFDKMRPQTWINAHAKTYDFVENYILKKVVDDYEVINLLFLQP